MKKILFMNGPPRVGKDTAVNYVYNLLTFMSPPIMPMKLKFSQPLKDAMKATFSWSDKEQDYYEHHKDEPQEIFAGLTYRQMQIDYSEKFLKPRLGNDCFGRLALERINKSTADAVLVSDSGFVAEAEHLVHTFGIQNCLLVRLSRPGTSFNGDSRGYIHLEGVRTIDVENNGSFEEFEMKLLDTVYSFFPAEVIL